VSSGLSSSITRSGEAASYHLRSAGLLRTGEAHGGVDHPYLYLRGGIWVESAMVNMGMGFVVAEALSDTTQRQDPATKWFFR
jgi:hypothetical protein